jgi:cobalt-zinc-cadmium efflux system membrane fusion protein
MRRKYLPIARPHSRRCNPQPVVLFGCLLGLLAFGACTPAGTDALDEPAPRQATSASTADALRPKLVGDAAPTELTLSGEILTDGNRTARVFPLVGGQVVQVAVELGDEVRWGQPLAVLSSGEITSLQNEHTASTADLAVARKNLAVAEELYQAGLSAEQEVYRARMEVTRAVGTATKHQRQLSVYGMRHEGTYVLHAPLAGFITEKHLTTGLRFTTANVASAFTVANLDSVWVMANVFETDLTRVQLDQPVEIITLSSPDQRLHGRINKVFHVLDHDSKVMKVRCTLPNPGHQLKHGMHARVRILSPAPN